MSQAHQLIKKATDLATVSQHALAAEVGVSALTISYWRNGRRNPTARNIMELGRVLLEHSRGLELAAHELMRMAQQDESRQQNAPGSELDKETLELFDTHGEAA